MQTSLSAIIHILCCGFVTVLPSYQTMMTSRKTMYACKDQ